MATRSRFASRCARDSIRRPGQAVGIRAGALQLALDVPENWIPVPDAPGLGEWEVHPRRSWNYALDIARAGEWQLKMSAPGDAPFERAAAPVTLTVPAALANEWRLNGAEAAPPPPSPVSDLGAISHVRLIPYGSARIRISEFPVAGVELGDT